MERLDELIFRYRNLLADAPLAYALASTRWTWEADRVVWPLAVGLCLLGIALRSGAVAHCGYAQGRPKELATTGPYAHVRNPLYLGNLLILAGATTASRLVWLVPPALAWACLVYRRVARHENRRLLARYGEAYVRYRDAVPAWLPRGSLLAALPLRAPGRQLLPLALLLPFVAKELDLFGLWGHP